MEKKISPITERILYYANYKGFSKRKIYIETGISNGVFDKTTGLGEGTIEKFISTYTEVNPTWLLTGRGEMLISGDGVAVPSAVSPAEVATVTDNTQIIAYLERKLKDMEQVIADNNKEIGRLMRDIEGLRRELQRCRCEDAQDAGCAAVG